MVISKGRRRKLSYDWNPNTRSWKMNSHQEVSLQNNICSHPNCKEEGKFRAPVSNSDLTKTQMFCKVHIIEYNKNWNFYKGMSPEEIEKDMQNDLFLQKPSWPMGFTTKMFTRYHQLRIMQEAFAMYSDFKIKKDKLESKFSKDELDAMKELGVTYPFSEEELRSRYRFLAKKYHPDIAKDKLFSETKFKKISHDYQLIKKYALVSGAKDI